MGAWKGIGKEVKSMVKKVTMVKVKIMTNTGD